MEGMPASLRRKIASARVGHFATLSREGPALVPITFVMLDTTVYHMLDAKPKRVAPASLRRVRNIQSDARAAVIFDHYEEDWERLWFVAVEGRARLLVRGLEHDRAVAALKRKYPQYRTMRLPESLLVIAVDVKTVRHWQGV
jgi:PPOX class probable F420-dependent enzyme